MKDDRKKLRKQKRQQKKENRRNYFSKIQCKQSSKKIKNVDHEINNIRKIHMDNPKQCKLKKIEDDGKKERELQEKLQKSMKRQRIQQLINENLEEDLIIKKLEKNLNFHNRKTKTLPKSFIDDGLAYMIEAAELGNSLVEQDLNEINDDFENDFILITGGDENREKKNNEDDSESGGSSDDDFEKLLNVSNSTEQLENENSDESEIEQKVRRKKASNLELNNSIFNRKRKGVMESTKEKGKKRKIYKKESDSSMEELEGKTERERSSDATDQEEITKNSHGVWEDIYGRFRTIDGAIIDQKGQQTVLTKYTSPAIRAKMDKQTNLSQDKIQKLEKLKKRLNGKKLEGLLNRLAESNMRKIANEIEVQYMNNSRNDMNETLCNLIMESLISPVTTPERLLIEHVSLIAILHANVGNEVGAHFLQTAVQRFNNIMSSSKGNVEDKTLANVVNILSQMYNFRIFDANLLYEILHKLTESFNEKNIECILMVLKSVGFSLRKDDPFALKNFILEIQKLAADVDHSDNNYSRIKFLLEIVLAIKNNNVTKIPNYDPLYSEHLKKVMKGFIRKGNYISQLNISLEDLLKADERGKWWVIGSAWSGNTTDRTTNTKPNEKLESKFSEDILDLAKKQRMNTESRRDIFCTILSSENYMDAFEKLLKLGLKHQQERDMIQIILHCSLQEKNYNPFYAILVEKFCEYNRRFQMTIRCSIWDKLKTLNNHSGNEISNLAKLLMHLFIEKALPIAILKIVEFGQLDKVTLRFMRQILLGILIHKDIETIQSIFEKVAYAENLKMFREGLRLFIHHFLLKNLKISFVPEDQKLILEERVKLVENILTLKDFRRLKL